MAGSSAELNILIKAKNLASAAINGVRRDLQGLDRQIGRGLSNAGRNIERGIITAGAAFATGVGYAVKAAGDFEAQLNTINTIAKLSDGQLRTLGEGIRETFRETGQPLEDLTSAYYDLLSAGIAVEDAQSILNTSVKLGIGGLATTKESVDLLTTAVNAYQLTSGEAAAAADVFAAAVRDGKVTVSEISMSFADVAPLAAQYGVSIEEIGAAYATLTARGVPAAEVGTQMNRAMIELLKPGPELVTVMESLGSSFEDLIRQKGLVGTLQDVRDEADKLGIPFQDLFGRLEGFKFALATTGENSAHFTRELEAMYNASGEVNAQFSERQQGLNFQMARLRANVHDAAITIGQALIPKLADLAAKATDWISKHQPEIKEFAKGLAEALEGAVVWASKLDWERIGAGLATARDVAKTVLDTFLKMPSWVQTAVITGWGLNKLTGGAFGSIIGTLAGSFIKRILGIQAGVVNINAGVVNGGLGAAGGAAAAAGRGGFLLGISRFLGLGSAIALGALLGREIGHNLFFDQAVKPAVDFETDQFEDAVRRNRGDVAGLQASIDAINDGLEQLGVGRDPVQDALANFLYGDQIKVLQDQKAELERLLAIAQTTEQTIAGGIDWNRQDQRDLLAVNQAWNSKAGQMVQSLAPLPFGIGKLVAKDFSPRVNVNTTVQTNVTVSATRVLSSVVRIASATGQQGGAEEGIV